VADALKTASPAPRARVQAMKSITRHSAARQSAVDFNENTLACSPKSKKRCGGFDGRAYALSRARADGAMVARTWA